MSDRHREHGQGHDLDGMIEIQNAGEIPQFQSEAEEAGFWLTHSLASHFFTHRDPRSDSVVARTVEQRQRSEAQDRENGVD